MYYWISVCLVSEKIEGRMENTVFKQLVVVNPVECRVWFIIVNMKAIFKIFCVHHCEHKLNNYYIYLYLYFLYSVKHLFFI